MWREIKKIIHKSNNFIITTHVNPDGDGIGSSTALIELLLMMRKKVRFVCDSPISSKFHFLDFHSLFERYTPDADYSPCEVLILVDTHKKDRIGQLSSLTDSPNVTTICIDHHPITESFTPYSAIDPHASSSGSMVYTLFKECGFDLNKEAATSLYASIICDTGRFCYASTDRKAHKIAEECIKKGVDPDRMYAQLFRQISMPEFQLFARVLHKMELICNNRVIVQTIELQDYEGLGGDITDLKENELEYILEFDKLVAGVECILFFRELEGKKVRVSARSNTNFAVDEVMRSFGGGGHHKAAGALLDGPLNEVKEKVMERVQLGLMV